MNEEIRKNLEKLYNESLGIVNDISVENLFDNLINNNSKVFYINEEVFADLYDEHAIKCFKEAKKNPKLVSAFEKAKKVKIDENVIIGELKDDILNSIPKIKSKIDSENKGIRNQIMILEYDYEPFAYISGFGEGDYPILKKPKYFDSYLKNELYAAIEKIDYANIWKDLILVNDILEHLDVDDQVFDTDIYQGLLNTYIFKTYLLLHEAFGQIRIEAFEGIEIKKPFFIYGNEHDCEPMNIFVYQ